MSMSQIIQISSGFINNVHDPVCGMAATPGGTGASQFAGQLGKTINLDSSEVRYDSSIGTVFGGNFQYVQCSPTDWDTPVIGQMVFWDAAVAENLYQVVNEEDTTTLVATSMAGVILSAGLTAGQFTFIQTLGLVKAKFVASITGTKATGRPVFISVAGGASVGLMDIVDDITTTAGAYFFPRYVGYAVQLPTDGGLTTIDLNQLSPRG